MAERLQAKQWHLLAAACCCRQRMPSVPAVSRGATPSRRRRRHSCLASRPAWARYGDYKDDGPRPEIHRHRAGQRRDAAARPVRESGVHLDLGWIFRGRWSCCGLVQGFYEGALRVLRRAPGWRGSRAWDLVRGRVLAPGDHGDEGGRRPGNSSSPNGFRLWLKGAGGKIPGGATLYFEVKLAALGDAPRIEREAARRGRRASSHLTGSARLIRAFAVMPPTRIEAEPGVLAPRARARCSCGTPSQVLRLLRVSLATYSVSYMSAKAPCAPKSPAS